MRAASRTTKRRVAALLAAALVLTLVFVGVSTGLGHPGVPEGDVAIVDGVDGGTVSEDSVTTQTEARLKAGLKKVPPSDDPQYTQVRDGVIQNQVLVLWFTAEAAERGVTVDAEEVDARVKEESAQLEEAGLTQEEQDAQVEAELLSEELIKKAVLQNENPQNPTYSQDELAAHYGVDDEAIKEFYEDNPQPIPASRDIRVILNTSEAKVEAAKKELEADDSDESWQKVAAKYSQDQASKGTGGLLEGLIEGSNDPQLEKEAFAAEEGELVGPFETDRGFYLIQVEKITEAGDAPLDKAKKAEIQGQLISSAQQETYDEFLKDFLNKWIPRTTCQSDSMIPLCRGFKCPETPPAAGVQPPPSPPASTRPIAPGDATIQADCTLPPQLGLPQGPQPGPEPPAAAQLPAGALPVGAAGAPPAGTTTAPPAG